MFRKITRNRMKKFIVIKEKVSLYSNQVTFNYNQWCHRLHLGSTQYKQFPRKKKKKLQEEKRKGKRGGKEEKKKKGMEGVCAKEGETYVEEEEKKKGE